MKEKFEFRIFKDNYEHLHKPNSAVFNGAAWIIEATKDDPIFAEIEKWNDYFKTQHNDLFYAISTISRSYSHKELATCKLFHFFTRKQFEPVGEECGTIYDESVSCEICGANSKQVGPLRLKKSSIPKSDVACTIAGEMIFSEKFVDFFKKWQLKGTVFEPVLSGKGETGYFQMKVETHKLDLIGSTIAGRDIFNDFPEFEDQSWQDKNGKPITDRVYYKCPKGHLIGGNQISELFVSDTSELKNLDVFMTRQLMGARKGVIRPSPFYLCSADFRKMVIEEKLKGFDFEIAHIE